MNELSCTSVSVSRAGKKLVDNVSLHIGKGELVGLIGPNGAGKSTLLQMLAGLIKCDSGEVYLQQKNLASLSSRQRGRQLAWVAQNGPVNWPLTVERIVSLGRRPHLGPWQHLTDDDKQAIEYAIEATDCHAIRHQDATTLSGGERTRMLLARALATQPEILLADEPVAALDLKHQLKTMQVLRDFANRNLACLVVLHDLSLAAKFCDRLYLMNAATIVAGGTPTQVLTAANIQQVYGVEVHIGGDEHPWILPVREC